MGKYPRRKQKRLAEKLLHIRLGLNLSQNEILRHLGFEDELSRTNISNYELGQREPPLYVLLRYARIANIWMDVLVDDELDLPNDLPSSKKHEGLKRVSAKGKKR